MTIVVSGGCVYNPPSQAPTGNSLCTTDMTVTFGACTAVFTNNVTPVQCDANYNCLLGDLDGIMETVTCNGLQWTITENVTGNLVTVTGACTCQPIGATSNSLPAGAATSAAVPSPVVASPVVSSPASSHAAALSSSAGSFLPSSTPLSAPLSITSSRSKLSKSRALLTVGMMLCAVLEVA